jgi:hypothetical protein
MPKRSSKLPRQTDDNVRALDVVRLAVDPEPSAASPKKRKDPAAVALGRKGGKKGGKARAEKLSAERRSEIARQAAEKRWQRKPPPEG